MRAFVTGATGFLGSFLTERLCQAGVTVAILTRPGSHPWRIEHLLPGLTRIEGDLRDLSAVEKRLLDFQADIVFHLAWHGVAGAMRDDVDQIDANLHGTLALARWALRAGCKTWVGLGSQAEYGPLNTRITEDAATRPTTTYGVVKLCAGLLAGRLFLGTGTRFVWLRVFSTYGPKDNPGWLIPYVVCALLDRQKPSLTPCEQNWDYLYVEDAVDAMYRLATTPQAVGVFNLGSGHACRLRAIVERVRDMIDPALPLGFGELPYRPDQVMHLEADITRLTTVTGWQPRMTLERGLRATVDWYRQAK